jgi:diguanylate cyclase (GGDEF)-like protein
MKPKKEYIYIIIIITAASVFLYNDFLNAEKTKLKSDIYKQNAQNIKNTLDTLIDQKEKATLAIALSISSNKEILEDMKRHYVLRSYYQNLIDQYNKYTLYKNIWIELQAEDKNILYRSWVDPLQESYSDDFISKEAGVCIEVNDYTLLIKAQIPFYENNKYFGSLKVFSHFNSISKSLYKDKINSVVVVHKNISKNIKYPFTNIYLKKDYYVSDFDVNKSYLEYMEKNGINRYLEDGYRVENNYLIVTYILKDIKGNALASYVMFKNISDISTVELEYEIFKWLVVGMLILLAFVLISLFILFIKNTNLKEYYKQIIDNSTNVVIIIEKDKIIDANKLFFSYLDIYKSLDEFKEKHNCVSDFFQDDEGYIKSDMDGMFWLDYILLHSDKYHKVKIEFPSKIRYFSVSASIISNIKEHYIVVFSDITEQENYKKEIEKLTITDTLTGINNRRYFHRKIDLEIERAIRYEHSISLIMFDIDFFKKVNDTFGHDVGDNVLKKYTGIVSKHIRKNDVLCRIGGEEFIIILPYATIKESVYIAKKIREVVEDSKVITPITMSFGVVEYIQNESADDFYKRVDDALYKAKNSGRNKVVAG